MTGEPDSASTSVHGGPIGPLLTTGVPTAQTGATAGEVRSSLAGRRFESATEIVVEDGVRFVGLAAVEEVLAAAPDTPLDELVEPSAPTLTPADAPALAAHVVSSGGHRSLAVVDANGRFCGLVPPSSAIALLHAEHDEDLARLGGYAAGSDRARGAAREPVRNRLWHRLPWLLVGLLGAMASALIVAAFETQLEANVLIAYFVPAVVYMADAVGTQTETVLIRGLAAGVTSRSILRRELLTGVITGTIIGAAFLCFAAIGWGDMDVAVAVAVALLASCSIATAVAMLLPTVIQALGADPAFGSGPLATVIQDLLSILVYFAAVVVLIS